MYIVFHSLRYESICTTDKRKHVQTETQPQPKEKKGFWIMDIIKEKTEFDYKVEEYLDAKHNENFYEKRVKELKME